jgi:hypothetical protein
VRARASCSCVCRVRPCLPAQRLRALSRRVHAEAALESDPFPIAFPRTAQTAGLPAATRKPAVRAPGKAPPATAGAEAPAPGGRREARGAATAGELGQMENGLAQVGRHRDKRAGPVTRTHTHNMYRSSDKETLLRA